MNGSGIAEKGGAWEKHGLELQWNGAEQKGDVEELNCNGKAGRRKAGNSRGMALKRMAKTSHGNELNCID